MTKQEHIDRVKEVIEEDFVKDVDGFWYYQLQDGSLLTEYDLTIIADLLSERNKEWNEHINKHLGND